MVRAEIKALRAEVADIRAALKSESADNTKHFNAIYRYLADMRDHLMPVVHKVFPGFTDTRKQIDAFMERYGGSPRARKRR